MKINAPPNLLHEIFFSSFLISFKKKPAASCLWLLSKMCDTSVAPAEHKRHHSLPQLDYRGSLST